MAFRYPMHRYPMPQIRREMDRLLNEWLTGASEAGLPLARANQPAVNVWETGEAIHVELELPGVKSDQLDISVVGNELSLKVQRSDTVGPEVTYHRRERPVGTFNRLLRLPSEVDGARVEAELRNGILTIKLPKAEAAKPRKIHVNPK
jgi:HSP20 family protein